MIIDSLLWLEAAVAVGLSWRHDRVHPYKPGVRLMNAWFGVTDIPGTLMVYERGRAECVWWTFGSGSLERMLWDAGFSDVQQTNQFQIILHGSHPLWQVSFRAKA